jgi:hypothetical protein
LAARALEPTWSHISLLEVLSKYMLSSANRHFMKGVRVDLLYKTSLIKQYLAPRLINWMASVLSKDISLMRK